MCSLADDKSSLNALLDHCKLQLHRVDDIAELVVNLGEAVPGWPGVVPKDLLTSLQRLDLGGRGNGAVKRCPSVSWTALG